MPYPIEKKLVIAVASSALFDLEESDRVFREQGEDKYREYQQKKQKNTLKPGVAFPFIKRLLSINDSFPDELPVEVVLLSRNDPDTGLRVFYSINNHKLGIQRAGFMSGKSPFPYIPAFNASLFLSANESDVKAAIESGYPAGVVLQTKAKDDKHDKALRVAFDFDGVLADDEAETVFQKTGNLKKYHASEIKKHGIALKPGPLNDLFTKLASIREIEIKRSQEDPSYKRIIRTAIVTARGAPAHERLVETLRKWGVTVDETFFLGGIDKIRILEIMKPHIYFDDQMTHLKSAAKNIPSVHIPFGIANKPKKSKGRKRS